MIRERERERQMEIEGLEWLRLKRKVKDYSFTSPNAPIRRSKVKSINIIH